MLNKLKLAPKLALILGSILTISFVILIAAATSLTKSGITKSVSGELTEISKNNGNQLQQIFDTAENTAASIQNYMDKSYRLADSNPSLIILPTDTAVIAICRSAVYDQVLAPNNYDVEQYITETARNTALTNDYIEGVGVMFEPYRFQSNMKNYAFYVDKSNATGDIEPFGLYDSYCQEPYYQKAAETKKAVVTEPYDFDGRQMIAYAIPILYKDNLQGVVMANVGIDNFAKVDASNEDYPSMYATIYDSKGDIVYDSENPANIGKNIGSFTPDADDLTSLQSNMANGEEFTILTTREDGRKLTRFFTPLSAAGSTWWSMTAVETSDINKSVNQTTLILILSAIIAFSVLILTVILVLKRMLKPLNPVVDAARHIAEGRLDGEVSSNSQDEIGILSSSFGHMTDALKNMVDDVSYLLDEMADGNFNIKTKAEESYVGDFESFLISIRKLNRTLSSTLAFINQASEQVASGSEQVSYGAQALSQGATEQASSIQELAATVNDISVQIQHTSKNAQQARDETILAGEDSIQCTVQMFEMIGAINDISTSSSEIGNIIKTIEDIAFQTNILALNAAVEAARAGQAGRGFAVVADEVRNLASKSAEASKNTAALIENSIQAVEKGSAIANETANSLNIVLERTQSIAHIVDQIAEDATSQATAIEQVTMGIDQISSVVQTNSATAEESAAASEELSGQSMMLKELVSKFRLRQ